MLFTHLRLKCCVCAQSTKERGVVLAVAATKEDVDDDSNPSDTRFWLCVPQKSAYNPPDKKKLVVDGMEILYNQWAVDVIWCVSNNIYPPNLISLRLHNPL